MKGASGGSPSSGRNPPVPGRPPSLLAPDPALTPSKRRRPEPPGRGAGTAQTRAPPGPAAGRPEAAAVPRDPRRGPAAASGLDPMRGRSPPSLPTAIAMRSGIGSSRTKASMRSTCASWPPSTGLAVTVAGSAPTLGPLRQGPARRRSPGRPRWRGRAERRASAASSAHGVSVSSMPWLRLAFAPHGLPLPESRNQTWKKRVSPGARWTFDTSAHCERTFS